jgi:hypothetical protein
MKQAISHLLVAAALASATSASAERLFGLTFDNRIVTFDSADPETVLSSRSITGLAPGDSLIGIDLRPANNKLYTMSTTGTLYELDRVGGSYTATSRGVVSPAPSGSNFGFDFNPQRDRLRVVSDTDQNLRIVPDTAGTTDDGKIMTDVGAGMFGAVAYTNNIAMAPSTTLYAIDTATDMLLRSLDPNLGTYTATNMMGEMFQPLGLAFTTGNALGFDISGLTNAAYLSVDSLLWTVDLETGAAGRVGIIGAGPLRSLTAGAVPEPATWAMLISGFGLVGAAIRRRRVVRITA